MKLRYITGVFAVGIIFSGCQKSESSDDPAAKPVHTVAKATVKPTSLAPLSASDVPSSASSDALVANSTGAAAPVELQLNANATTTVTEVITVVETAASVSTGASASVIPTFGYRRLTSDGFTVQITNYDPNYTWTATATAGTVQIDGSGLVTVTGVPALTRSKVTITTERTEYTDGSATVLQPSPLLSFFMRRTGIPTTFPRSASMLPRVR